MLTYTKIKEAQVISQDFFQEAERKKAMIKRKCAKAILFIAIFTIALAGQVVQKEKVQQRNLEYAQLQERSIDKTVKESAEVMSYVEGISEQAESGRDKALAKEEN